MEEFKISTDQVHRNNEKEAFSIAGDLEIYLGTFKIENAQQTWQGWWSYCKLSNDRALRSTCLSRPNRYSSWEMQSNTSIGDVVRLFPFPKTSPVSSSKKLISIQRCRRLWGSFGLASYSALNAIYWIMNLLCSLDRVNSSKFTQRSPKKLVYKVTLWSRMKFKWNFLHVRVQEVRCPCY